MPSLRCVSCRLVFTTAAAYLHESHLCVQPDRWAGWDAQWAPRVTGAPYEYQHVWRQP